MVLAVKVGRQMRAPIEARPGFSALLDRIEGNGVRIVLVEDASRFARDLVAQELGLLMLIKRDVRVLTAAGDDMTDTFGAVAHHDAADRRQLCSVREGAAGRQAQGGPRPQEGAHREMRRPQAAALAAQGHLTGGGRPYSANAVQELLQSPAD
jgi:hypothetical protein